MIDENFTCTSVRAKPKGFAAYLNRWRLRRGSCFLGSCFLLMFIMQTGLTWGPLVDNQFEHLSVKDGLSHNSVNCILQDREGFLWFGTNDGLNKYDGYVFTVLQPDPAKPNASFRNNRIGGMCEGRGNRL